MRNRCRTGLAALMGLSVLAVAARAAEEEISPEKLPSAVKKAVKKEFPDAKIWGASKEVEDGDTTYEVRLKHEGRSVDVTMDAEGEILEIEEEVTVHELPKAVRKRLAAKYPGAKIEKAEKVTKGEDGPVRYEVAIKAEVVFTAKGKIIQAKEEDEDNEKPAAKAKNKKEKEDEDEDGEKSSAKSKKKEKKEDKDDDDAEDEDEEDDDC